MKLFSSIILFLSLNVSAKTPFILITYEGNSKISMLQIQKIMDYKFKISKNLYKLEYGPCNKQESIGTHLCIDNQMNVKIISRNEEVMTEMLGVYWK